MVGDREKCLAAGCDDYISKPITPQGLRDVLIRYIPGADDTTATGDLDPTDTIQTVSAPDAETAASTTIDQLRERFLAGLPERTQILEEAWRTGNREAIGRAAHQLKGTAGAYGLSRIAQAAAAVEVLADGKNVSSDLQPAVNELLRLCQQAGQAGCSGQPDTLPQE
jgi:HPt (histidine-containing phosphotransfer) domain-containing protein